MTRSIDGAIASGAAMMMALAPVTGSCEGRVMLLCGGDNTVHRILVWNREEQPVPQPSHNALKACHACLADKRKGQPDAGEDLDEA